MAAESEILYLKHHEIDKNRYDDCITNSINTLIYAHSFYLDNMCPEWDALASEDYSWVMPLTWNNKWGVKYLYQPPFIQQLGVFKKADTIVPWKEIITILMSRFSFWEIGLNFVCLPLHEKKFSKFTHTNFVLPLNKSYEEIFSGYHKDLVKNLKRSKKCDLIYRPAAEYKKAIDEYISHYAGRMKHVTIIDYNRFRSVCKVAKKKGMVVCREVVNDLEQLLAIVLLFNDGKRLYNIMNTTTSEGRKVQANHFLLDAVIKEFSGSELLFDFEGSDLVGVRTFYENFGAENQPYYFVKYNNLPLLFRLFK